jgi:glycine dehydrogenase subunit 2
MSVFKPFSETVLEPLLFELSAPGRTSEIIDGGDVPTRPLEALLPAEELRASLDLPEVTENIVVRHYTRLSQLNMSVDTHFYPLGSCTMKYNPRVNERAQALPGFALIHPFQPDHQVQGALQLMYELQAYLAEIAGMRAVTLQPAAGAHGELAGVLMIRAHHLRNGDRERKVILVPDSAHGTNPATAAMCGFQVAALPSDRRGNVDMAALKQLLSPQVAGLMLTIPNTLGLFDEQILEISERLHAVGALLYCDGANMNALVGQVKLGQLGCDVLHINLHKTFSQPHGGGGPGAGPVAVSATLEPYLPVPLVAKRAAPDGGAFYYLDYDRPHTIGRVRSFYGQFGALVRAYTYIRSLGQEGLRQMSETAVLNANYLFHHLRAYYDRPYDRDVVMHEAVLSGRRQRKYGVRTLDIAKRLIDYGFHPPTIYFPLIVDEALMIEPTESESKETLDAFIAAMQAIAREAETNPELVTSAPHDTPVVRLDEARAARQPNLRWRPTGAERAALGHEGPPPPHAAG